MKKYLKIENLLYLMIILSPFFDSFSFIYRSINKDSSISPITIIRPIIPIILAIYMFIKDKSTRKVFIIGGLIYFIYGFIHLFIYNELLTGISYGGITHEAQYIINYTYMIFVLYIFIYFYKNKKLDKLKQSLLIMLGCYLLLIYLSIITKTSSTTYIEGMGFKGWNLSGNSLGSILIMLECLLLTYIISLEKNKKILGIIIFISLGIFLTFLLGTRTGMFGFYLVLIAFFVAKIFINLISKNKLNLKKNLIPITLILIAAISLVAIVGSNTLSRRQHLESVENTLIDPNTNKVSHVTGDTANFVKEIKKNNIKEEFMSYEQQMAYLDLYEFANKNKITNNNQRIQQFIYHINLIKHQKNMWLILFGNGYEINYGEMTLEMEYLALILNFGIIGFLLYMLPFLIIEIKALKYLFKNIKKINIDYIMYLLTVFLAIVFSTLAGYTFFNASSVLIIICTHVLLKEKYEEE